MTVATVAEHFNNIASTSVDCWETVGDGEGRISAAEDTTVGVVIAPGGRGMSKAGTNHSGREA